MSLEVEVDSSYCSSFGILHILLYRNITFCINLVRSTLSFCLLPYVQVHHDIAAVPKVLTHVVHTGGILGLLSLHLKKRDYTINFKEFLFFGRRCGSFIWPIFHFLDLLIVLLTFFHVDFFGRSIKGSFHQFVVFLNYTFGQSLR